MGSIKRKAEEPAVKCTDLSQMQKSDGIALMKVFNEVASPEKNADRVLNLFKACERTKANKMQPKVPFG